MENITHMPQAARLDITHTREGDIDLAAEDITYSESTHQHQKDILLSGKGYYKSTPATGVGLINFLQDTNPENLLRTVRKEFARDGMKVNKISYINGQIKAEAYYDHNNR